MTTQSAVASGPESVTTLAEGTSTSSVGSTTPPVVTTAGRPSVPPLVVGTADGVMLWTEGVFESIVAGMPCRVAFQFADGTVVYQETKSRYHDVDATPVMILRSGTDSGVLVEPEGVSPILWGVGEIDGRSVVVYERWPDPCGWDESLRSCEGRLLALDLIDATERDLGAFSAPGYALGPSDIQGGIVLNFNSGAEVGNVGSFLLHDLNGKYINNPVCINAVDCGQPMRMLGALSSGADELAYVLDRMQLGAEEIEYQIIDRRYGVVDVTTGETVITVDLNAAGHVAWLDFNGEHGLVSVTDGDKVMTYLIGEAGAVETLSVGGIATLPES